MKLTKWMFGAMALTLMAACSDKDVPDSNGLETSVTEGGGFIAMKINLAQQGTTRANDGSDVEFKDGKNFEFQVDEARVWLFTTATEDAEAKDAKYFGSFELKGSFNPTAPGETAPGGADQITASEVTGAEITKNITGDPYLWALVVINKPDAVAVPQDNETFSHYLNSEASITNANFMTTDSLIFMTNAPLSLTPGKTFAVTANPTIITLVELGQASKKIKKTLPEAKEDPAGCIYVERALAKVTATCNPEIELNGADGNKITGITASAGLALRNTNTKSYVVRNVDGLNWTLASEKFDINPLYTEKSYRMLGLEGMPVLYAPLHTEAKAYYRTYFCKDVNYEDPADVVYNSETKIVTDRKDTYYADTKYVRANGTDGQYAKENTFTVANQSYGNSTLALFKVTLTVAGRTDDSSDLWIVNDNHNVIYTSQSQVTELPRAYIYQQDKIQEALKKAAKKGAPEGLTPDMAKLVRVNFEDVEAGVIKVKDIVLKRTGDPTLYDQYFDTDSPTTFNNEIEKNGYKTTLISRVNSNWEITKYAGGVSYYQIPVAHFGQATTPWKKTPDKDEMDVLSAYGEDDGEGGVRDNSYLGRYGMVRNNWYELSIKNIKAIGSPTVPDINFFLSDDNDPVKTYIGIETHILSWAKRAQDVSFE